MISISKLMMVVIKAQFCHSVFITPSSSTTMSYISSVLPLTPFPIPKFARDLEMNEREDEYTTHYQKKAVKIKEHEKSPKKVEC